MANPNSANVITAVKSPLDSPARDTLVYIISSASPGENKTDGLVRGGWDTPTRQGCVRYFTFAQNSSRIRRKRFQPVPRRRRTPAAVRTALASAAATGQIDLSAAPAVGSSGNLSSATATGSRASVRNSYRPPSKYARIGVSRDSSDRIAFGR